MCLCIIKAVRLTIRIKTSEPDNRLARLAELVSRYCPVGTLGIIMTGPGQTDGVSIFIEHVIEELDLSRSLIRGRDADRQPHDAVHWAAD